MTKNKFNIKPEWLLILYDIFERTDNLEKVFLFGSRARGDNKPRSDIDLLVDTSNRKVIIKLINEITDSNNLVKVDVVNLKDVSSEEFKSNIDKEAIILWQKKLSTD